MDDVIKYTDQQQLLSSMIDDLLAMQAADPEYVDEDGMELLARLPESIAYHIARSGGQMIANPDGYVAIMRWMECYADGMKKRADRLVLQASCASDIGKAIHERLYATMTETGLDALDGNLFKLAIQANPPAVGKVDAAKALAAGYAKEVTTIKPDAKAIVSAWKADPASVAEFAEVAQSTRLVVKS